MIRTGIGFDSHRVAADRPLVLGGVRMSERGGLDGHSDADALTHAIIDALLGAAALGDIGRHFPDTDPAWKGADSLDLLRRAVALLAGAGFAVVNVDSTVIAERPRLAPHAERLRAALASALGVPADRVSVKAKTAERMGALGRGEGLAAMAVATVEHAP